MGRVKQSMKRFLHMFQTEILVIKSNTHIDILTTMEPIGTYDGERGIRPLYLGHPINLNGL